MHEGDMSAALLNRRSQATVYFPLQRAGKVV
jgi:hypothetical protein